MYRNVGFVPLLALMLLCCGKFAAAENVGSRVLPPMYYETGRPLFTPVNYTRAAATHAAYADPSCGAEAGCAMGGNCGAGGECCEHVPNCLDGIWDNYCGSKRGCRLRPCGSAFLKRGCRSACSTSCDTCEPLSDCHACASCGSSGGCGCAGQRWGFQGCAPCCKPCYRPHCGPIRCWANGWCGETVDGFTSGHPVCAPAAPCSSCGNGSAGFQHQETYQHQAPPAANPGPPAAPADAPQPTPAPAPEKAARRMMFSPVSSPRFANPGFGIK